MRQKRYYIKGGSAPRIPTAWWIAVWLLMDRLNAPQWAWGIYWFCAAIFFAICLYMCYKYESVGVDAQIILKAWKESEIKK